MAADKTTLLQILVSAFSVRRLFIALAPHVPLISQSELFQITVERQRLTPKFAARESFGAVLSDPLSYLRFAF
jgi:hypothetical protein